MALKNNTEAELAKVAKQAINKQAVQDYIKRVLNSQKPLEQRELETPMQITKTSQGLQAFKIRLSADMKEIILDTLDPTNFSNARQGSYHTSLMKILSNGQKVALGLVKHDTTTTTSTTTKKVV